MTVVRTKGSGLRSCESYLREIIMQLLVTSGSDASRAISLGDEGVLRVGRGVECEVRLNDVAMSRGQFELKVDAGRVWLRDTESRFGTFVNGVKTAECELRPGGCDSRGGDLVSCGGSFAGQPDDDCSDSRLEDGHSCPSGWR